jgi:hypothetical protein
VSVLDLDLTMVFNQGAGDEAAAQAESHIDQSAAAKRAFDAIIGTPPPC